MITRLLLENWRAYRRLELELPAGTTFVIARNGIGKTSLVQGVAWGLFGEKALKLDPGEAVSIGRAAAHVELDLSLPNGGALRIERTFTARGRKAEVTATSGARSVRGEEAVATEIARTFGAEVAHLPRLLFMGEGTLSAYLEDSFDLRGHLYHVFGVRPLLEAAESATRLEREARKHAEQARHLQEPDPEVVIALQERVGALRTIIEELEAARADLQPQLLAAQQAEEGALRWEAFEVAVRDHDRSLEALAREAASALASSPEIERLAQALEEAEVAAERELDSLRQRRMALEARITATQQALSQLDQAGAHCPVCLRPLEPDGVAQARHRHEEEVATLRATREDLGLERPLEERLQSARALKRRLSSLPAPIAPQEPRGASSQEAAAAVARLHAELNRLSSSLAERRRESEILELELSKARDAASGQAQVVKAYYREGLATALRTALGETAGRIVSESIDPIAAEVARRWKLLMGTRGGLRLRPDGRLCMKRGEHEIEFRSMSGGEKAIAVLLTHLFLVGATTRAGFMWLDEPLEHLDPRNRRMLASTLAQAARTGLRQILVTTYEDTLARGLALSDPTVNLVPVTAGDE
ncbi:MAG: AAA family ATPase [Actinomycetota bacterium]